LHRGAVAAATLVRLRALVDVLARQRAVRLSVDRDGLTVLGSTGQPRANPLLAEERLLREEADSRLREWRFSGGR
jgi:hypothetical protein